MESRGYILNRINKFLHDLIVPAHRARFLDDILFDQ
jgi:hypothetical protein